LAESNAIVDSRPPGAAATALIAVSVIFFAFGVNVGMWAAHIPVIQSRLGIDTATLGLSLLSAAIGTMFAQPLAGMLVARVGSRPTTVLFSVLSAIAMAAAIASGSVVQLFIALAFIGIMWGAANVAMNTQGTELEVLRARPTLSSFHAFASLGMLAGAALGGILIGAGWGNGEGAAAVAILSVIASLLTARMLLDARPQSRGASFTLPNRAVLVLGLLALLMFLVEGGMVDWSALFLATVKGASESWAPFGFVVFTGTMAAFRLLGNRIVTALGRRNVVVFGGLLVAAGMALAILSPWLWLSVVGFVLVGAGAANVVPTLIATAGQTPGIQPSMAIGAVTTMMTFGLLVGPPVVGLVAHRFGLPVGLCLLAAAGLAVAALARLRTWPPIAR